jgi:DNA-binding transcriptional LysR family regulator
MDLWQLHIFCKVVELKSFSKAGEAVRLSQPTVSSHIKDLETHFERKLIDRMTRNVTPTKAGLLLYDYARRLLALRDMTETAMAEYGGKIKGRLLIGGSTIPGGYLLPRIIGRFTKRYPEVYVSLTVADTMEIAQKTVDGYIELSVVGARSQDKNLHQEAVVRDDLCIVVPPDHKWVHSQGISAHDLPDEPFIIRESGSGTLHAIETLLQDGPHSLNDLRIVAEMGSTEAVRQAIKGGVGISILSRIAVMEDVRTGLLRTVPIKGLDLQRNFYLTTHKQRSLSPLSQKFINFLKQEIRSACIFPEEV